MKKHLNKTLNGLLHDEKIAPKDYSKLKKLLPMEHRKKITQIQRDERRHHKILVGIRKELREDEGECRR